MEVSPLARGVMLPSAQPLSAPLQNGFRFFHHPLPTIPMGLPCGSLSLDGRMAGLTRSATMPILQGLGPDYPPEE